MNRIFATANKYRNQRTLRQLSLSENLSILDIGCGNGDLLFDLLHHHPSCLAVGIELSDAMTTIVRRRNTSRGAGHRLKLATADWNRLPFSDGSFDRIVACNIIYFWERPQDSLSEIRRILKSDGKVTIMFQPVLNDFKSTFLDYGYDVYSQEEVICLLEQNGFQMINVVSKDEESKDRSWQVLWITASL